MKERISSAICTALMVGTTITVLAQGAATSQTPSAQSGTSKAVTVTGCVARAQEGQSATTGTTGTAGVTPQIRFVLTSANIKAGETTEPSGTAAPPTTAISSEYRLDADEAKLVTNVGHKVEITGTIEQQSRPEQKPPASAANAPTLKVDTVKVIAPTCS